MGNIVGSLNQVQKSIIIGSVLGDGYLRIMPGRKDAFLEINHSFSERDYVDWKFRNLRNLTRNSPKKRRGKGKRIAYRFFTRQHPELTKIYQGFYYKGRKIIPNLRLDPLIVAVWFMDDGSKIYNSYYLNSQGFDYLSQQKLIDILDNQYKIKSSLNRDKKYFRIRIRQNSAENFRSLIQEYIIPSMKYKLGDDPVETS